MALMLTNLNRLFAEAIPPTLRWKGADKLYLPMFKHMDLSVN